MDVAPAALKARTRPYQDLRHSIGKAGGIEDSSCKCSKGIDAGDMYNWNALHTLAGWRLPRTKTNHIDGLLK